MMLKNVKNGKIIPITFDFYIKIDVFLPHNNPKFI